MAKFTFRLEAVLRHRRFVEDQRQGELAAAQREMARLEGELRALNEAASSVTDDVRANRLTGRLDMNFLAAHRRYAAAVQRKGMIVVQEMAKQQREVDRARAALAEAVKRRKIVEKLKERQRERWVVEQGHKDAAETDEVGMQLSFDALGDAELLTGPDAAAGEAGR